MWNNLRVQEGGGNQTMLTTVSQDAYSVWPLVTYALHGAGGTLRGATPSSSLVLGDLTYQRLSQILTISAMLAIAGVLAFRKRAVHEPGAYLPVVAIGVVSFFMLLTGVVATHFILALPLLVLSRPWMSTSAYLYVIIAWSVTTLVPMYGDMGAILTPNEYPLLAPEHNPVTQFFVSLYSWDRFITTGIVANICALVWVGWLALRPSFHVRLLSPSEA
jgi:hypothetical protein